MLSIFSNLTQSLLHDEDFCLDQTRNTNQALFQTADLWLAEVVLNFFSYHLDYRFSPLDVCRPSHSSFTWDTLINSSDITIKTCIITETFYFGVLSFGPHKNLREKYSQK